MTPTELRDIIDDLALEPALSLRLTKARALHLVLCKVMERLPDDCGCVHCTTRRQESA